MPPEPATQLSVDIAGTRTLADELAQRARAEREYRFLAGRPTSIASARAREAAVEIFGGKVVAFTSRVVWSGDLDGHRVRLTRYRGDGYDVPAFELDGSGAAGSGTLLYLPEESIEAEHESLLERARRFERIVAIDYLGIGELASDQVMLHTLARTLMYAEESLPRANVRLLRGMLTSLGSGPVEVEGAGWAASFYASILQALEPERVRRVHVSGVPDDELSWLGAGSRVPDLLLHPGLYSRMTVAELTR